MSRRNLISLGFGILGMLVALGAWHLFMDHIYFHNILNAIAKQQQVPSDIKK